MNDLINEKYYIFIYCIEYNINTLYFYNNSLILKS